MATTSELLSGPCSDEFALGTLEDEPGAVFQASRDTLGWRQAWRLLEQQRAELDAQRVRLQAKRRRIALTLKQQRAELREQLQQFHDALTAQVAAPAAAGPSDDELAVLRRERDTLRERLAAAEAGAASGDAKAEDQKMYELRRRFEMAVEDMRAYKHRVEELEQQLAQRPKAVEQAAPCGKLDWAQQKAKMLASLETDMAGEDQQSVNDRLTVEGAVRITDEVVAEKEREIQLIRQQMEDLKAERIAVDKHDTSVATVLDHDAVIVAERERLRKLQESMIEKQRQAEIEFAVERAKFARQRVELDDRMHAMQSDLAQRQAANGNSEAASPSAKPARGRWLARLGLKDGDE